MANATEARPFLPADIILRMVEGTANEAEQRRVAATLCRMANEIKTILRNGIQPRDVEIMERAAATTEAIHDALFEAQCRRSQQAARSEVFPGGAEDFTRRFLAGPLAAHSIAR